mmetsp:Transcript_42608/g.102801  ORF Transcript_42608/g.102801 Transcript_42608/m.102801 type:complete len:278 (-) Transcript_42608:7-840(-)
MLWCLNSGSHISPGLRAFRLKSPKERDTEMMPLTRHALSVFLSMKPPAASTRLASAGFVGLWSSDSFEACPFLTSTERESPTFAHTRFLPLMTHRFSVLPSGRFFCPASSLNVASNLRISCRSTCSTCCLFARFRGATFPMSSLQKFSWSLLLHIHPLCPSNTPKMCVPLWCTMSIVSSWFGRRPFVRYHEWLQPPWFMRVHGTYPPVSEESTVEQNMVKSQRGRRFAFSSVSYLSQGGPRLQVLLKGNCPREVQSSSVFRIPRRKQRTSSLINNYC